MQQGVRRVCVWCRGWGLPCCAPGTLWALRSAVGSVCVRALPRVEVVSVCAGLAGGGVLNRVVVPPVTSGAVLWLPLVGRVAVM